jgi:hypothetical protein
MNAMRLRETSADAARPSAGQNDNGIADERPGLMRERPDRSLVRDSAVVRVAARSAADASASHPCNPCNLWTRLT